MFLVDAGSSLAVEGALYTPPSLVPYTFKMAATVEGYHGVKNITSDKLQLSVKKDPGGKLAKVCRTLVEN